MRGLDGPPRQPKPWTAPHPPKPISSKVFDRPTVLGLACTATGSGLWICGVPWGWAVFAAGAAGTVGYAVSQLVASYRIRRWAFSPPTTTPPDDAL